jgi:hypothetical protein
MPLDAAQKRANLLPRFPNAARLDNWEADFKGIDKLYKFREEAGDLVLQRLAATFTYGGPVRALESELPGGQRLAGLQTFAGFSPTTRTRVGALPASSQAAILVAILDNPNPNNFQSGPNLPPSPATGKLVDATRPNTVYTVLDAVGNANKNYILDVGGVCVAEVDFGNHGGDAVSGHCHVFPIPGVVALAHHNEGGIHVGLVEYPAIWRTTPAGVNPAQAIGA